jgi:hypothetical protein
MVSQTNLNPKGDALLVLRIMVTNCPDDKFKKETVLEMLSRIAAEPSPQNLLKGADFVAYMQAKERSRIVHGPATTDRAQQTGG